MNLSGRVALITGGKRIGAVVAAELATRGADVALVYHSSADEANSTADVIRALGRRAAVIQADLRAAADCARAVEGTVAALGRLDVLINMASIYRAVQFDALTEEHWNNQLSVDLTAAFLCSCAAVPHLKRAGGGRIMNFADWVARSAGSDSRQHDHARAHRRARRDKRRGIAPGGAGHAARTMGRRD